MVRIPIESARCIDGAHRVQAIRQPSKNEGETVQPLRFGRMSTPRALRYARVASETKRCGAT
jgi:hypothetical protein